MIIKQMILLAQGETNNKLSVAGIDKTTGEWIRLVQDATGLSYKIDKQNFKYINKTEKIKLLDVIEVHIEKYIGDYKQQENFLLHDFDFKYVGHVKLNDVLKLVSISMPYDDAILGNDDYPFFLSNQTKLNGKSLLFARAYNVKIYNRFDENRSTTYMDFMATKESASGGIGDYQRYKYFEILDDQYKLKSDDSNIHYIDEMYIVMSREWKTIGDKTQYKKMINGVLFDESYDLAHYSRYQDRIEDIKFIKDRHDYEIVCNTNRFYARTDTSKNLPKTFGTFLAKLSSYLTSKYVTFICRGSDIIECIVHDDMNTVSNMSMIERYVKSLNDDYNSVNSLIYHSESQNPSEYEITVSNIDTGETVTFSILDNEKIKLSTDFEAIASTNEGCVIENNQNIKIIKKGKCITSFFKNVKRGEQIPFNTNKISYKYFYVPREESDIYFLILNGLKKYPEQEQYMNEFISLKKVFMKMLGPKRFDTICGIPGHLANTINDNSIARMIKDVTSSLTYVHVDDGSQVLIRKTSTEPSKSVQGIERESKFYEEHLKTIEVQSSLKTLVENKNILLIDDVVTSGTSMKACKQILLNAGAKTVTCFAFAMAHTQWRLDDVINTSTQNILANPEEEVELPKYIKDYGNF